ncbi:MAG: FAD binding domain-containing protein [bacterium]
MKPAPFQYFVPQTLEEAFSLLDEHGFDAKLLAGGQSLVPTMNFRLAQPAVLIDLNHVEELFYIRKHNQKGVHIGAMTRQATLERSELITKHAPLIAETMPHIAHPQIRNRGTLGGSLAHADPASELPAVMFALEARFRIQSRSGDRWLEAKDFFVDLFTTDLAPEEMLTEIVIPPLPPETGCAFQEVSRRHGDFALVGVAACLTLNEAGGCQAARIVLLSVGSTPVRAHQAEQVLVSRGLTDEALHEAAQTAAEQEIDPPADMHASSDFRRQLAKVLTERALKQALERARSA